VSSGFRSIRERRIRRLQRLGWGSGFDGGVRLQDGSRSELVSISGSAFEVVNSRLPPNFERGLG
jgi:hypothetical protein